MDRFNELIELLTSDSIATRITAVQDLGELGDSAQ